MQIFLSGEYGCYFFWHCVRTDHDITGGEFKYTAPELCSLSLYTHTRIIELPGRFCHHVFSHMSH